MHDTGISAKPFLILLYGRSAVGKTTLVKRLSRDSGVPFVGLDEIKETLYECGFTELDKESSELLNTACYEASMSVIEAMVRAGRSVIVDFHCRENLKRLKQSCESLGVRFVAVDCVMPDENARRARYNERISTGERHPGHSDTLYKMVDEEPAKLYEKQIVADITLEAGEPVDKVYDDLRNKLNDLIV